MEIDRRTFITRIIPGAATVTASLLAGYELGKADGISSRLDSEKEILEQTRIYTSGDTIPTPLGPVSFEGWQLKLNATDFTKKREEFGDSRFLYIVEGNKEFRNQEIQFTKERGYFTAQTSHPGAKPTGDYEDGKTFVMLGLDPTDDNLKLGRTTLGFWEFDEKGEKVISKKNFTLNPKVYHAEGGVFANFEEPLDDELMKGVEDLVLQFEDNYFFPLGGWVSVLLPTFNSYDAWYNHNSGNVVVPLEYFKEPQYENQGFITLYHELCHSLLDRVVMQNPDQRLNDKMFRAYQNLIETAGKLNPTAGFKVPLMERTYGARFPENVPKDRFIQNFLESSYVKPVGSRIFSGLGHSYDNYNELFASTATILRYFPEELRKRFEEMNDLEKRATADVVKAVFEVFRESLEDDAIKKMLPNYDLVLPILNF